MNSEWVVQKNRKLMSWKVRHGSGPVTKSRYRYSQKISNSSDICTNSFKENECCYLHLTVQTQFLKKFVVTENSLKHLINSMKGDLVWKSTDLAETHIQGCQFYWNSISDQLANPNRCTVV